jgi:YD repeat-containing protein
MFTCYKYDEAGNELAQIDALNRTNSCANDSQGRRIRHTLPGGQVEGFAFDLGGNLVYQTNYNGMVITHQYDELNRLTNVVGQVSGLAEYAYDGVGNLQTAGYGNGVTNQFSTTP